MPSGLYTCFHQSLQLLACGIVIKLGTIWNFHRCPFLIHFLRESVWVTHDMVSKKGIIIALVGKDSILQLHGIFVGNSGVESLPRNQWDFCTADLLLESQISSGLWAAA